MNPIFNNDFFFLNQHVLIMEHRTDTSDGCIMALIENESS